MSKIANSEVYNNEKGSMAVQNDFFIPNLNQSIVCETRDINQQAATVGESAISFEVTSKNINETIGNKKNDSQQREEYDTCLCKNFNKFFKSNSIFKTCINTQFGFPIYSCTFFFLIACTVITTIAVFGTINSQIGTINRSYFANCSLNSDCDSLKGLQCSSENGICNCPAVRTKGHCDCSSGYFWNGTQCARLMQYLDKGCSANYMCDQSKYLICLNKTCTCDTTKIMDPLSLTCRYKYLGCYNDSLYSSSWVILSPLYLMEYFVDICINGCKYKNNTYSYIYWSSNNSRCYCLNTISLTTPVICDINCVGKNGEKYKCGSSTGNGYYHSVYYNFGSN